MFQHGPNLAQLGSNLGPKTPPKSAPRPLPRATYVEKPKTLNFEYPPMVLLVFWGPRGCPGRPIFIKNAIFKQHVFQECFGTLFSPTLSNISSNCPKLGANLDPKGGVRECWFLGLCWLLGPNWAKMAPRAPKSPPRRHLGTILVPFWCHLGASLAARWRLVGAAGGS